MDARLSAEDAAAVLRRAAELDAEPLDEPGHLDEAVLRQAAAEVGLSSGAVDRAVAEWRSGALVPLPELAPALVHGVPLRVDAGRTLPLPPDEVLPRLESWLRGQLYEPRRGERDARDWIPRHGPAAQVSRATDLQGRIRLRDVRRIRVQVTAVAQGSSRVVFAAELEGPRGWALARRIAAPGAVVLVGVAAVAGPVAYGLPEILLTLPAGAVASGASWQFVQSRMVHRRDRVAEELECALDALMTPVTRPVLPGWLPPSARRWAGRFGLPQ